MNDIVNLGANMEYLIKNNISSVAPTSVSRNKLLLSMFIAMITILMITRDIAGMPLNKYLFVVISAVAFCLLDYVNMICAIAFLFPLLSGLPANYIMVLAIVLIMTKRNVSFTISQLLFMCITILGETIHLFGFLSLNITDLVSYFAHVALILLVTLDKTTQYLYRRTIISFLIGIMVQLFVILFASLKYVGINDMIMHGIRFGDVSTLSGNTADMVLTNNQNNIAYYCVLALSCLLILIYKYKANHIAYYFLLFIPIIFGFLTVSRTFILVSIPILILYMAFMIKKSKKNIIHLIYISAFLLLGYFLTINQYHDLYQNILYRFQSKDLFGGRDQLFAVYNNYLFSHVDAFLVGTGLFPMESTVKAFNVPHNGFQQVFVAYGILGFIAFIFLFYLIIKNAINKHKIDIVFYLPLIAMVAFIQTVQLLAPYELMMPIIIAFCSIRLGALKNKIQQIN
jgi:hypothetical protein